MLTFKTLMKSETKRGFITNCRNRVIFGKTFPQHGGSIIVDPSKIEKYTSVFHRNFSCCIKAGNWDILNNSIYESYKYKALKNRFVHNMSWEETGIYNKILCNISESKFQISDGCRNISDIKKRYRGIDKMYSELKRDNYLKPHSVYSNSSSELLGILVHFGRNGNLIFGNGGNHRFYISKILNIKKIPCLIGVIHKGYSKEFHYRYMDNINIGRLDFHYE